MKEVQLRPLVTHNLLKAYTRPEALGGPAPAGNGFGALLAETIGKTAEAHRLAAGTIPAAAMDAGIDVHQVMIAQEEASITFELLMEVRNKLLEGYQQLMAMQV
ncbi:flagellar hook-basal body complex protein FliE [bacterium]|nr:flagellar hook-basal body complex protein FliE [bacterium]